MTLITIISSIKLKWKHVYNTFLSKFSKNTPMSKIKPNQKQQKVKFLKSPTGVYKLGYSVGDIASFPVAFAAELIESEYAEAIK